MTEVQAAYFLAMLSIAGEKMGNEYVERMCKDIPQSCVDDMMKIIDSGVKEGKFSSGFSGMLHEMLRNNATTKDVPLPRVATNLVAYVCAIEDAWDILVWYIPVFPDEWIDEAIEYLKQDIETGLFEDKDSFPTVMIHNLTIVRKTNDKKAVDRLIKNSEKGTE